MNDRLLELEIMKILQEYRLLLLDEEYKNEMISMNKADFLKEISEKGGLPEPPVEEPPVEEESKDNLDSEVKEEGEDEEDIDFDNEVDNEVDEKTSFIKEGMKKLYRKIVKLTHPDKTMHKNNKKELNELYIRAKKAMSEMDVYEILTICDRLDIEYSIDINQKDILEENLIKKREKLKSLESSFIWLWIKADSDVKKDEIVNLFLQKHKKNI